MKIERGDTVFVTGGGGGIGLEIARCCAARGANLVLADIFEERLEATCAAFDGPVLAAVMDVSQPVDWERARAAAEARFGAIDVLVNCAAIPPAKKPLLETSVAEFDERIAVNLGGSFYGLRCFGPPMLARGRGHLCVIASDAGLLPMTTIGDYVAAKYGVVGLGEVLRAELAGTGVGVTVAIPGITRTNMTIGMGMEASFVGQAIFAGIESNAAYVVTHPQLRESLDRRIEAIRAAIGEPAQPGYLPKNNRWQ